MLDGQISEDVNIWRFDETVFLGSGDLRLEDQSERVVTSQAFRCRVGMMARLFLVWLLLGFVCSPVLGQQIFIKNQPFSGAAFKDSTGLWVELTPLEWALNFEAKLEAEGARVGDRLVRTQKQGEKTFVPLTQIASALGAVVKENPEFQTVDVHLAVRPKSGLGLDIKPSDLKEPSEKSSKARPVEGQPVSTAAYSFTLPTGMKMTRDPRLIKTALAGKKADAMSTDLKFDALATFEGDNNLRRGGVVFTWFEFEVPKEHSNERDTLALSGAMAQQLLQRAGCQLIAEPKIVETRGQSLVLAAGVTVYPPHNGMMVLTRLDPKRKRAYLVIANDIPDSDGPAAEKMVDMLSTVTTR